MKRMASLAITLVLMGTVVSRADVEGTNLVNSNLSQATSVVGGGDSTSSSSSSADGAWSYLSLTSNSNVQGRTSPIATSAPYLPLWNHGGWGTVKGYFANGPTTTNNVYERMVNPDDKNDRKQLRKILGAVPYTNPLQIIPGLLNEVSVAFGGPDKFHHGRGFEISNTVIRERRPEGKRLMIYIDSNVDKEVLKKVGYAYVGKISIEGKDTLSWDQVYSAAMAEVLPWNVDILLVSGGMKGVTVGQNVSFPSAAFGYSQTNYSLSLTGGMAKGVTEGKGKPVLSAEAFRYCPEIIQRQTLPREFYKSLERRAKQQEQVDLLRQRQQEEYWRRQQQMQQRMQPSAAYPHTYAPTGNGRLQPNAYNTQGVQVNPELYNIAGFDQGQPLDYMSATQTR